MEQHGTEQEGNRNYQMKYVKVNMPREVYKLLEKRQQIMTEDFQRYTGKKKRISKTNVMFISFKNPIQLDKRELIHVSKRAFWREL